MSLQSTDLILVNRNNLTYKMTGDTILDPITSAQTTANSALSLAQANEAAINALETSVVPIPVGTVVYVAMNSVPPGFLPCDGGTYNTTSYAALFAAISYNYGGSGNTFSVPDLRNRFVMGFNSADSRNYGTVQGSQNKSHNHAVSGTTGENNVSHTHPASTLDNGEHHHDYTTFQTTANINPGPAGLTPVWSGTEEVETNDAGLHNHTVSIGNNNVNHTHSFTLTTESEGGTEARPTNMNLLAVIKF